MHWRTHCNALFHRERRSVGANRQTVTLTPGVVLVPILVITNSIHRFCSGGHVHALRRRVGCLLKCAASAPYMRSSKSLLGEALSDRNSDLQFFDRSSPFVAGRDRSLFKLVTRPSNRPLLARSRGKGSFFRLQ